MSKEMSNTVSCLTIQQIVKEELSLHKIWAYATWVPYELIEQLRTNSCTTGL